MDMKSSLKKLHYPKSLAHRTQPEDFVERSTTKTSDNKALQMEVYERGAKKWFVILAHGILGWTDNVFDASDILNNAELYKLKELIEMIKEQVS